VSVIEDGVAPLVEGASPFETEAIRRKLFVEYTNVDLFFAPVEVACWDLVGKALGKPVYELLGGWTAPTATARAHRQHLGTPNPTTRSTSRTAWASGRPRSRRRGPGRSATTGGAC
jgi:L-alanine-DL-glutamate epimerase-like enolase superfamily enzyme